ncbi:MAG TPA: hypothetical protein VGC67_04490 [Cellulomonas sp.]
MFEFRAPGHGLPVDTDWDDVSRLFDGGDALSATYVEDPETGTRLTQSVGLGYGMNGGVYLFRWHGRTMAVEHHAWCDPTSGPHRTEYHDLRSLGTTPYASVAHIKHDHVFPTQQEHDLALRTAIEAALVYETHMRSRVVDEIRIADPDSHDHNLPQATYLTLTDFGYPPRTELWDPVPATLARVAARRAGGDAR